jgi:hypothetical protein
MVFCTIRSACQLMGQINCNLLFSWSMGFLMCDEVWKHSTFTKNRGRLPDGTVTQGHSLSSVQRYHAANGQITFPSQAFSASTQ